MLSCVVFVVFNFISLCISLFTFLVYLYCFSVVLAFVGVVALLYCAFICRVCFCCYVIDIVLSFSFVVFKYISCAVVCRLCCFIVVVLYVYSCDCICRCCVFVLLVFIYCVCFLLCLHLSLLPFCDCCVRLSFLLWVYLSLVFILCLHCCSHFDFRISIVLLLCFDLPILFVISLFIYCCNCFSV